MVPSKICTQKKKHVATHSPPVRVLPFGTGTARRRRRGGRPGWVGMGAARRDEAQASSRARRTVPAVCRGAPATCAGRAHACVDGRADDWRGMRAWARGEAGADGRGAARGTRQTTCARGAGAGRRAWSSRGWSKLLLVAVLCTVRVAPATAIPVRTGSLVASHLQGATVLAAVQMRDAEFLTRLICDAPCMRTCMHAGANEFPAESCAGTARPETDYRAGYPREAGRNENASSAAPRHGDRHLLSAGSSRRVALDLCDCGVWSCENGYFLDTDELTDCSVCNPCPTACDEGFWMSGLCTPFSNGCSSCAECPEGEYISVACGGKQPTVCTTCTACEVGKYVNISCGLDFDALCLDCPNAIPALAHYELGFNVSTYACWWSCDEGLVYDSKTRTCECPAGFYYDDSDDPNKFDVDLQAFLPVGCVECQQCPGIHTVFTRNWDAELAPRNKESRPETREGRDQRQVERRS